MSSLFDEQQTRQAAKLVRKLDLSKEENRKFLVEQFRELENMIESKPSFCLYPEVNIADEIIEHSKFVKPYMTGDFLADISQQNPSHYQKTLDSKLYHDEFVSNRKCAKVKVRINGDLIPQVRSTSKKQNDHKNLCLNSSFSLSLFADDPNCTILYTLNGKHPLMANPNEIFVRPNHEETTLEPPCIISAIAVFDRNCIESQLQVVEVRKQSTKNSTYTHGQRERGMVRPGFNYNLEDSVQSLSASSSYVFNIDNNSQS